MSICAYCEQDKPSTKEHIIPAFLYRFQKEFERSTLGWNDVAQKMLPTEGQIKDVCGDCNGGVLSKLDAAGKEMLSKSNILVRNYTKSSITLHYDFHLLTRWLLKISYNSARTTNNYTYLFERFIPYMISGTPEPNKAELAILIYMAKPTILSQSELDRKPYSDLALGSKVFNPFLMRICNGLSPRNDPYTIRMIFFGPLIFFMLFFDEGISPGNSASEARKLTKMYPGAKVLDKKKKAEIVTARDKSWLHLYAPQIMRAKASESSD